MMYTINSLCPNPLTVGNYLIWKHQFEGTLRVHKLLSYISRQLITYAPLLEDGQPNLEHDNNITNDAIVLS